MTPVRWGIAGTGTMAGIFAAALASVPDARLVAVGSRSPERARRFAETTGVPRAHADLEGLFADDGVDVVYVATTNELHAEVAQSALEAGKHVLVEKPFAVDEAQGRALSEAAGRSGRFCMEAMWTRFLPAVERLEQLVADGTVGDVRLLTASLGFARELAMPSALLDLGVYPISLAHLLFGEPIRVDATIVQGPGGVDVLDLVSLTHSAGRVSQLASATSVHLDNRLSVTGSAGRLTLGAPMLRPDHLVVERLAPLGEVAGTASGRLRHHRLAQRLRAPVAAALARAGGRRRVERVPYLGDGYVHEVHEVHRCLTQGRTESPRLPLAESVAVLRTVDRAREAARHG